MNQDRYTELAADYALGLLEGEDLEGFEAHLAGGCSACERELAAMDAVGDAFALSVPPAMPAPAVREHLMAAVEADLAAELARPGRQAPAEATPSGDTVSGAQAAAPAPEGPAGEVAPPSLVAPERPTVPAVPVVPTPAPWAPPREVKEAEQRRPGRSGRFLPALAFAALLAALLAGGHAFRLQRQLELVRVDLERVTAEKAALARIMDVVRSERLQVVAMSGLAPSPTSQGRVLWSPEERKAVFHAYGLPAPPAGTDYQLWVIEGQTPRSEGVFPVDAAGRASHVLPEVPDAAGVGAFAVTLEPAGGMPQPTGEMFLLGAVTPRVP